MRVNFLNRAGRTYLIANPDNFGNGKDLGYYRETLFGEFEAVILTPYYDSATFQTEEGAQQWIKTQSGMESDRT